MKLEVNLKKNGGRDTKTPLDVRCIFGGCFFFLNGPCSRFLVKGNSVEMTGEACHDGTGRACLLEWTWGRLRTQIQLKKDP